MGRGELPGGDGRGRAVRLALLYVVFLLVLAAPAAAEHPRFVPQLGLTEFRPKSVAFHPKNDDTLLVVEATGRISLFDVSNPGLPIRISEFEARARTAAFHPAGDRIVSASRDGTVRLWTLDGTPVAAPFRGHDRGVTWVAFNPEGDRIASVGEDGTIRLWGLDGTPAGVFDLGAAQYVYPLGGRTYAALRADRTVMFDSNLTKRGEIFLHRKGIVVVTEEGVLAPTDELRQLVRAVGADGTVLTQPGAVPALTPERLRHILFDE